MSDGYDYKIFIGRDMRYTSTTCTTSGSVTPITRNIKNKWVCDPQINNNEKEIFITDGDILLRYPPPCAGRDKYKKSAGSTSH